MRLEILRNVCEPENMVDVPTSLVKSLMEPSPTVLVKSQNKPGPGPAPCQAVQLLGLKIPTQKLNYENQKYEISGR